VDRVRNCLVLIFFAVGVVGCAKKVALEDVYGTYLASYPFGTETLTLQRDGNFLQTVSIGNKPDVSAKGTWRYDATDSRITLTDSMIVVDGFDKLRSDWRTVAPGVVSMDVEKHWSRVLMASAAKYPYVKR
jgi:hypothetical protein